jgi:uncharacterized protein (TIGR03083 family)
MDMIPSSEDLAALALGAVDDDERAFLEALIADDPDRRAEVGALAAAAAAGLGGLESETPPVALWERIANTARIQRPPGEWVGHDASTSIDEIEALRRSAMELDALLQDLPDDGWDQPVPTYGRVRDLVAHLVAIEDYTAAQLGAFEWTGDLTTPHIDISEASIRHWANQPVADLYHHWRQRVAAELEAASALSDAELDQPAHWHGANVDRRALLVIRTFELWSHSDDIRRAIGVPIIAPDVGRLSLMTRFAVRLIPTAMDMTGRGRPGGSARIVLTGPGGGAWSQPLGVKASARHDDDALSDADVSIVADGVDFCRVATRRLRPDELSASIDGDHQLGHDLLVSLGALAAD